MTLWLTSPSANDACKKVYLISIATLIVVADPSEFFNHFTVKTIQIEYLFSIRIAVIHTRATRIDHLLYYFVSLKASHWLTSPIDIDFIYMNRFRHAWPLNRLKISKWLSTWRGLQHSSFRSLPFGYIIANRDINQLKKQSMRTVNNNNKLSNVNIFTILSAQNETEQIVYCCLTHIHFMSCSFVSDETIIHRLHAPPCLPSFTRISMPELWQMLSSRIRSCCC